MSIIGKLGKYVIIPILIEWLNAVDIGEVDTAICNRNDRPKFIALVIQYHRLFEDKFAVNTVLVASSSLFEWIISRNFEGRLLRSIGITNLFINELNEDEKGRIKASLLSFLPYISSIKMIRCSPDHVKSLANIVQNAKTLTELVLLELVHTETVLDSVVVSIPNLTICNLSGSTGLSPSVLINLVRHCKLLANLNLKGCDGTDASVLRAITVHGGNLTALNLKYAPNIPPDESILMLLMLNTSGRKLKSLTYTEHTDFTLSTLLAYNGLTLTQLNLAYVESITDDSIALLGEYTYCPKIVKLNLENLVNVTNELLSQRLIQMQHLVSLNLKLVRGLSNDVLRTIIFNCKLLKELYLASNVHIDVISLQQLGTVVQLDCLSLCSIPALSNSLLKSIVSSCCELRLLDISSNSQVNNNWFLYVSGQLYNLHTLNLRSCINITSMSLLSLSKHCHLLTDVDLCDCNAISDEGLVSLISNNTKLVKLDVGNCHMLSDTTLQCLIQLHPSKLTSLCIRNCNAMSPRCICRLVQSLPKLKDLFVAQGQVDNEAKLRKCNPDLIIDVFY